MNRGIRFLLDTQVAAGGDPLTSASNRDRRFRHGRPRFFQYEANSAFTLP
jgi:hypothetical protein